MWHRILFFTLLDWDCCNLLELIFHLGVTDSKAQEFNLKHFLSFLFQSLVFLHLLTFLPLDVTVLLSLLLLQCLISWLFLVYLPVSGGPTEYYFYSFYYFLCFLSFGYWDFQQIFPHTITATCYISVCCFFLNFCPHTWCWIVFEFCAQHAHWLWSDIMCACFLMTSC